MFVYSSLHLFHFILSGKETIDVASHVLQFVFLGNNGFRFPFAHFPTKEADPASLGKVHLIGQGGGGDDDIETRSLKF